MHKLGLVIPYRDRKKHLGQFMSKVFPYLEKQEIGFEMILSEQVDKKPFNRGALLNMGFLEAEKSGCDYVVFHDVDMIPIDVDYSYSEKAIQLACRFFGKSNYVPFDYSGGVTLFPVDVFRKVGGYSNNYEGWGFEDNDMLYRCKQNRVELAKTIFKYPEMVDRSDNKLKTFQLYESTTYEVVVNISNINQKSSILTCRELFEIQYDGVKQYFSVSVHGIERFCSGKLPKTINFLVQIKLLPNQILEFHINGDKIGSLEIQEDLKEYPVEVSPEVKVGNRGNVNLVYEELCLCKRPGLFRALPPKTCGWDSVESDTNRKRFEKVLRGEINCEEGLNTVLGRVASKAVEPVTYGKHVKTVFR